MCSAFIMGSHHTPTESSRIASHWTTPPNALHTSRHGHGWMSGHTLRNTLALHMTRYPYTQAHVTRSVHAHTRAPIPTLARLHARNIRLHTPTHKVKIFHPRKAALRHERWKILKCAHETTRTQRSQRITRGCSHIHMGADAIHVARAHSLPGSHLCAYTYTHARSLVRTRIYTWPSVYKHGRKHVHTRSAQRTHVSKHT